MILHMFLRTAVLAVRRLVLLCLAMAAVTAHAQLANSGWPKEFGTVTNSNLGAGGNTVPTALWSVSSGWGPPVIGLNGTLYATDGSSLYAIDPLTGLQLWKFVPDAGSVLSGMPAVGADGTVYIGAVLRVQSNNSYTGAFYAVDGTTGTLVWANKTMPFTNSPTIGPDGTIYVAAGVFEAVGGGTPIGVCAVNPATGAVIWSDLSIVSPFPSGHFALSTGGVLYCPSYNANDIVGIQASNGTVVLQIAPPGPVVSDIAIAPNGTLYFGAYESKAPDAPIGLFAMDTSGNILWNYQTKHGFSACPAIDAGGTVYIFEYDGSLDAIDGSLGTPIWTNSLTPYALPNNSSNSTLPYGPVIDANGTIYLYEESDSSPFTAYLLAIDKSTGDLLWNFPTSPGNSPYSPTIAADGTLYVVTSSNASAFMGPLVALKSAHVSSLTLNPSTVDGGSPSTGTVTLSTGAPPGGATVRLASDNAAAIIPATVSIAAGQTTATFTVNTSTVSAQTVATLS